MKNNLTEIKLFEKMRRRCMYYKGFNNDSCQGRKAGRVIFE